MLHSLAGKAALASMVVAAGLLGGAWWMTMARGSGDAYANCLFRGVIEGSDAFGGPFELVAHTGETVTEAEVITKPTLIYFGYTFCPDVCPLDAARNAAAVDLLAEQGYDVQSVFVSVDPARDTPEALGEFVGYMHPDMLGLTGTEAQVAAAAKAYRATYSLGADEGDGFYLVNHSAFTYLTLPERGVVGIFHMAADVNTQLGKVRDGVTEEQLADATACFIDAT